MFDVSTRWLRARSWVLAVCTASLGGACGSSLPNVNCFTDADCPDGICVVSGDGRVCESGQADTTARDAIDDADDDATQDVEEVEDVVPQDSGDVDSEQGGDGGDLQDTADATDTEDAQDAPDADDTQDTPDADDATDTEDAQDAPDADDAQDSPEVDAELDTSLCETPPCVETGACRDAVDNDNDGVTDCDDSDCTGDVACAEPVCGDRTRDASETCDGSDTGEFTCGTIGFTGGGLACDESCELDVSGCAGPLTFEVYNDSYTNGGSYRTAPASVSAGDIIASCFHTPAPSLRYQLTEFDFMFGTGGPISTSTTMYLWGGRAASGEPTALIAAYDFIPVIPREDFPNKIAFSTDFPEVRDEFCVGIEVPADGARLGFDLDGISTPGANWYLDAGDGEDGDVWRSAAEMEISGDWIIRATLVPAP